MKTNTKNIQHQLIIPSDHAYERLDQALAKLLPDYSRTQIQEWIEQGDVLVNGKPSKAKSKVHGEESITINASLKPQPEWLAQAIELNIVYEDDSLLVINKPAGLVVHPGAGNPESTLLNALIHHVPSLKELPRAGIIHRLDKDTTGLLVVAKTTKALTSLSRQMRKRSIVREYQAIINGTIISGGSVNEPIERHHTNRKRMAVSSTGKPAITHYRIAEKFHAHTHLMVRLETGRTHQIRVHMAYIQHPIVGDPTYGTRVHLAKGITPALAQELGQYRRQALHAFALGLVHPVTQQDMRWEIDLPEDMQQLLKALRKDNESHKT